MNDEGKIDKRDDHGGDRFWIRVHFSLGAHALEDCHFDVICRVQGERYREGQKVVWRHFLVFYRHDYFLHFLFFSDTTEVKNGNFSSILIQIVATDHSSTEKLSKLTFILIANETFKLNQLEQVLSTPRQVQYWPCGEYHGTLWFG